MTQSLLDNNSGANIAVGQNSSAAGGLVIEQFLPTTYRRKSKAFAVVSPTRQRALSLIEIVFVVAAIGILAAIAIPSYQQYVEKARVAVAVTEIFGMSMVIVKYMDDAPTPPDSLSQVGMAGRIDPWGRPYVYTNLMNAKGKGSSRKDKKLNPLNSDFDLYSVGRDGDSKLPLAVKVSKDDVIRALDGRFVGLAKDFDP